MTPVVPTSVRFVPGSGVEEVRAEKGRVNVREGRARELSDKGSGNKQIHDGIRDVVVKERRLP